MSSLKNLLSVCVFFTLSQTIANEPYEFKGQHFIASYCNCNHAALTNVEKLETMMIEASKASGATVLQTAKHIFPPDGMTMVVLLSESHASIHTYPEFDACFVDLFTCGDNCSSAQFDAALRSYLQPEEVNTHFLIRHKENETFRDEIR